MKETKEHLSVEIIITGDSKGGPDIVDGSRVDVSIECQVYPTARLNDSAFVAWWFNADAPDIESSDVQKWVKAPTRFLAAGTLHEIWENPSMIDSLAKKSTK